MADNKASSAKNSYHHGELPAVLMQLAVEEIAEKGTEQLSLRSLARKAGVSQTAPYRHFPTKTCLLAALATQGFVDLRTRVQRVISSTKTIETRFIEMGVTYVTFALENPVVYQLMFGGVVADFSAYEDLRDASRSCYLEVRLCEKELIETKRLEFEPVHLGGAIWAGVHGIASLLLNMPPGESEDDYDPRQAVNVIRDNVEGTLRIMYGHLLD